MWYSALASILVAPQPSPGNLLLGCLECPSTRPSSHRCPAWPAVSPVWSLSWCGARVRAGRCTRNWNEDSDILQISPLSSRSDWLFNQFDHVWGVSTGCQEGFPPSLTILTISGHHFAMVFRPNTTDSSGASPASGTSSPASIAACRAASSSARLCEGEDKQQRALINQILRYSKNQHGEHICTNG
jgi:hypothetical protein